MGLEQIPDIWSLTVDPGFHNHVQAMTGNHGRTSNSKNVAWAQCSDPDEIIRSHDIRRYTPVAFWSGMSTYLQPGSGYSFALTHKKKDSSGDGIRIQNPP